MEVRNCWDMFGEVGCRAMQGDAGTLLVKVASTGAKRKEESGEH